MARRVITGRRSSVKHWHLIGVSTQEVLTQVQKVVTQFLPTEGDRPETVLRCRGELLVVATPDAVTDSDFVGLGIIVLHQNSIGVGGTSVPGPINDSGADWLWFSIVPIDAVGATAIAGDSVGAVVRVPIDSKAMRVMRSEMGLALVAELSSGDFASVTLTGGFRFLLGH